MKFEAKMSGTRVTDYEIKPVCSDTITLLEIDKFKTETAQWILDNYFLVKFSDEYAEKVGCRHGVWVDWDTVMKISILENYPEYEKELSEYFGKNWLKHYLRFNH